MKNKYNNKTFSYLSYIKDYRLWSFLSPFFKGLETLTELFVPFLMSKIIDFGIKTQNYFFIIKNGILILLLNIFGILFAILGQKFASKVSTNIGMDIRNDIFKHINSLSHSELDKFSTSTLLNRTISDVRNIQDGLGAILRQIMRTPVLLIGSFILAIFINLKLSLVFLLVIPIFLTIIFWITSKLKPLLLQIKQKLDRTTNITRENLTGIRVVRAFNKQNHEINRFEASNSDLIISQIQHASWASVLEPLIFLVVNIAIIGLFVFGGVEVYSGKLTQGKLIAFIDYFGTISVCLVTLSNLISINTRMKASNDRINELFLENNSIIEPNFPTAINKSDINLGKIEFKNVCFSYENTSYIVSNLSFVAFPGDTIGIIGGTASGKSSIVNLIPRFYDIKSGQILINDKDIKFYSTKQLRDIIGIVPQNPTLFDGTIRSNLCWKKPNATDDEIILALKISQSYDFVKEYPDFLEHRVARGGTNFSGGQRQRLTIARALVGCPHILILDDSSSALDYLTEKNLRKSIQNNLKSSTIFIVTQRTNSIIDANKIIVTDNGKIIDIGTHSELLERCTIYQEIYFSQNKKEEN